MRKVLAEGMVDGIAIDRVVREHEYNMPSKHFHNEYELYYLLQGERYYFIEKQIYLVKKGTLVIIPKNQIHKTDASSRSFHDRILIELKEEPFSTFFQSDGRISLQQFFDQHQGVLEFDEEEQKQVERLLHQMLRELEKKELGYEMIVKTRLAELLIRVMRYRAKCTAPLNGSAAQSAKHRKVHEVANYIVEHYTSSESLDALSQRFYMSKCYLSRIFKEITGFTVKEYINIQRIHHAKDLLTDNRYNMTEIANLLGYDSLTYFEKVFKKYTETSPLKYRKNLIRYQNEQRTKKEE